MSVMLFFLRYSSCRFKQFSKSARVLIRLTLNANTSTPRIRLMMETSLSSLPQQFSFLIAARSDCLDLAMTISSVSRAIVLPGFLRRASDRYSELDIIALHYSLYSLLGRTDDATFNNFPEIRFIYFLLHYSSRTTRLGWVLHKIDYRNYTFPPKQITH